MAVLLGPFNLAGAGTSFTVTGIPATSQLVVVSYHKMSFDALSGFILLRVGHSGGIMVDGYVGSLGFCDSLGNGRAEGLVEVGVYLGHSWGADSVASGHIEIAKMSGNLWTAGGGIYGMKGTTHYAGFVYCTMTIPGQLDRIRILNEGTATFDGGLLSVLCME